MSKNIKKIIILMFVLVGFLAYSVYAISAGIYLDEYNSIIYDWNCIISSLFDNFWPVFGMGLIMFFIVDGR